MRFIKKSEDFSRIMRYARESKDKSQEYVAKRMGVSKRTVQNWESGYSSPTVAMCIAYFDAIGMQPLPLFLQLFYGEFCEISAKSEDKMIENALMERVKACTPQEKRKLLFILYGDHGSSTHGILEMVTAHLHVSLKDRLNVAQNIILNYEIAEKNGALQNSEHILPDIDFLKKAFNNAYKSVLENKEAYNCIKE